MSTSDPVSDLHRTPTRLELLREVDAGHVARIAGADWRLAHDGYEQRRVDARCDEAEVAGWILLGPLETWRGRNRQRWQLTDVGRAVLDAAEVTR